jgi:hypothetical protein
VTRLGYFSPILEIVYCGQFYENLRSSPNFLPTFFRSKSSILIFTRNVLGYILCEFFTNSSDHPDQNPEFLFESDFLAGAVSYSCNNFRRLPKLLQELNVCSVAPAVPYICTLLSNCPFDVLKSSECTENKSLNMNWTFFVAFVEGENRSALFILASFRSRDQLYIKTIYHEGWFFISIRRNVMYVRTYVCTYICMYICIYLCMCVCADVFMYIYMYVPMDVCMYVCMYTCT